MKIKKRGKLLRRKIIEQTIIESNGFFWCPKRGCRVTENICVASIHSHLHKCRDVCVILVDRIGSRKQVKQKIQDYGEEKQNVK